MKKIFTSATILLAILNSQAQLKVGLPAGAPHPSAVLDISNTGSSTKAGFLAPQVQLTGINDVTTIDAPAPGLMIYNLFPAGTGSSAVSTGYYYFNGVKWKPFISEVPPSQAVFDASVLGYTPTRSAATAPVDTMVNGNRFIKKWMATNPDNGHSYALYDVRNSGNSAYSNVNWFQSFDFCKSIGGYLVTLTSNAETNFLKTNFLFNNSLSLDGSTTVQSHCDQNIWMGFAKIVEPGNPVKLGWITGERSKVNWSVDPSATETDFNSGEPNNSGGTEGYVHIWASGRFAARTWNDAPGSSSITSGYPFYQIIVEFNN